jgi:hypothetical protein
MVCFRYEYEHDLHEPPRSVSNRRVAIWGSRSILILNAHQSSEIPGSHLPQFDAPMGCQVLISREVAG